MVCLTAMCALCRPLLKDGEDDVAFCKRLTVEAGVTALPVRPSFCTPRLHMKVLRKSITLLERGPQHLGIYMCLPGSSFV